jgi:hypothetical protein
MSKHNVEYSSDDLFDIDVSINDWVMDDILDEAYDNGYEAAIEDSKSNFEFTSQEHPVDAFYKERDFYKKQKEDKEYKDYVRRLEQFADNYKIDCLDGTETSALKLIRGMK